MLSLTPLPRGDESPPVFLNLREICELKTTTRRSRRSLKKSVLTFTMAIVLGAALTVGTTSCASTSGSTSAREASFAELHYAESQVHPALVRIHVVEAGYQGGREVKYRSSGSGAIISPDGLVVTNHHVAGKATRLFVTLPSREEIPAELVGTDALTDIAIIRLKPYEPRTFPFAKWGDSSKMEVGNEVLAMGSPLALSQSVTLGIISNTAMMIPGNSGSFNLDGEDVGSIVRWLGHDATIFPGNSGGPLVNMQGEIIGINEIGFGLGGAIPSNIARKTAEEIVAKGEITRAHIGVVFQPLLKSQQKAGGVLVSSVMKDSPGAKAGIKPGDFVTSLNGNPVNVRFDEDLPDLNLAIANLEIGAPAKLELRRGSETISATVSPVRREPVIQKEHEIREWGITVRDLSLWTMVDLKLDSRDGVLVTSMGSGGAVGTAKPPVQEGDVLVAVNDKPLKNVADFEAVTAAIVEGKKDLVETAVTFSRQGKQFVTIAKVGIPKTPEPSVDAKKAWVPVDTQVLTKEIAKQLGMEGRKGVRVTQVYGRPGAPDAPLKVGDYIVAIDGDPIQASESHDSEVFGEIIRQYKAGTEVEFTVIRDGKESKVPYKLPLRPAATREMRTYRDLDFELAVREVTYLDRQSPDWQAGKDASLMVENVTPGGWAALAGLGVGDKLIAIDGKTVETIDDVKSALDGAKGRKIQFLVIEVQRGAQTLFVEIEPAW